MISSRDEDYLSSRTLKAIEILEAEVLKTRKMIHHLSGKPRTIEEDLDMADLRLRMRILVGERDALLERFQIFPSKSNRKE